MEDNFSIKNFIETAVDDSGDFECPHQFFDATTIHDSPVECAQYERSAHLLGKAHNSLEYMRVS